MPDAAFTADKWGRPDWLQPQNIDLGIALGVNYLFLPEIIVEKLGVYLYIMEEQRANEKEKVQNLYPGLIHMNFKDLCRLEAPHYEQAIKSSTPHSILASLQPVQITL